MFAAGTIKAKAASGWIVMRMVFASAPPKSTDAFGTNSTIFAVWPAAIVRYGVTLL